MVGFLFFYVERLLCVYFADQLLLTTQPVTTAKVSSACESSSDSPEKSVWNQLEDVNKTRNPADGCSKGYGIFPEESIVEILLILHNELVHTFLAVNFHVVSQTVCFRRKSYQLMPGSGCRRSTNSSVIYNLLVPLPRFVLPGLLAC